jgi:exodeoxyribonuclease-5
MSIAAPSGLRLTAAQQEAIDGIIADIKAGSARAVLCGYAGTGKTVATAALVSRLDEMDFNVVVATPTHKARAQVERALRDRGASGFDCVTVHRLLGLKMVRDYKTGKESFEPDAKGRNMIKEGIWDESAERDEEETWEDFKARRKRKVDVVIVDETSMVSSELYSVLLGELRLATDRSLPVVFVGDDRQLLPVGEESTCPAFVEAKSLYRLNEVLRHDGAILNLATATRELSAGRAQFASAVGGGTRVIAYRNRDEWWEALLEMAATEEALEDPDYCRALAWTNSVVENLNKSIHQRRFGVQAPQFMPGMVCVTCDAIPDPIGGGPLLHSTIDVSVRFAELQEWRAPSESPEQLPLLPGVNQEAPFQTWELELEVFGVDAGTEIVRVLAKDEEKRWRESQRLIAEAAKSANNTEDRKSLWRLYFARKDQIGRIEPASALTIHKSQGSTFRHVFLHWSIDGWGSAPTAQQNQLAYVGITRAAESLHVVGDR